MLPCHAELECNGIHLPTLHIIFTIIFTKLEYGTYQAQDCDGCLLSGTRRV